VDVGVDADIVEGPGEDGHRDRAGPAAGAEAGVIVTALTGSYAADDQPHDKK